MKIGYIDGANLHRGIQGLGWKLDYARFRIFLCEKFKLDTIYLFMGYTPENADLYVFLRKSGYVLVFKPTLRDKAGNVKGNCDAELVLQSISDFYEIPTTEVILVTGDGDFACIVEFFIRKDILVKVVSPDTKKCSILLKRSAKWITFLSEYRTKIEYIK